MTGRPEISDEDLSDVFAVGRQVLASLSGWLRCDRGRGGELWGEAQAAYRLLRDADERYLDATGARPFARFAYDLDGRLTATDLEARRREAAADRRELALAVPA